MRTNYKLTVKVDTIPDYPEDTDVNIVAIIERDKRTKGLELNYYVQLGNTDMFFCVGLPYNQPNGDEIPFTKEEITEDIFVTYDSGYFDYLIDEIQAIRQWRYEQAMLSV